MPVSLLMYRTAAFLRRASHRDSAPGRDIDIGERKRRVDVVAELRDFRRVGADDTRRTFSRLAIGATAFTTAIHAVMNTGTFSTLINRLTALMPILRIGLGVEHDHFDFLAVDAALGIDVVDGPLAALI